MLIFGYHGKGDTAVGQTFAAYKRGVLSRGGAVFSAPEVRFKSPSSLPCVAPLRGTCGDDAEAAEAVF